MTEALPLMVRVDVQLVDVRADCPEVSTSARSMVTTRAQSQVSMCEASQRWTSSSL